MILKVSTKALQESFEYFESIKVTDKIKIFVTDIQNNSRHTLYQYIIRYEVFNRFKYSRGFGSFEDVINELNNVKDYLNVWGDDFKNGLFQ